MPDVFSDSHFNATGEEPVEADEARKLLETEHKSTFDMLHKASRVSTGQKLEHITNIRLIENVEAFDGEQDIRTHIYVWTCLTRNRQRHETKVYFITDEFNSAAVTVYSAVHFILHPETQDKTVVKGIIEEPAIELFRCPKLLEIRYFLWYRNVTQLGKCLL